MINNNKSFITLQLHCKEITTSELNQLAFFIENLRNDDKKIEIISDYLPIKLKGKIFELSELGKSYFNILHKKRAMYVFTLITGAKE